MDAIKNKRYSKAYDSAAEMFADLDKEIDWENR